MARPVCKKCGYFDEEGTCVLLHIDRTAKDVCKLNKAQDDAVVVRTDPDKKSMNGKRKAKRKKRSND